MNLKKMQITWFFFKYSMVKRNAAPYFRELQHNQYLPRDELERLNWDRTRSLLLYAYEKVPYYKRRFDAIKLHPNDIVHPDDYCHVPLLTREDLRENFHDLVSIEAKPRDLRLVATGGSTGEPVKVYHQRRIVREAAKWRMLAWWDLSPTDDFARVYRQSQTAWRGRLMDSIGWWPTKKILLNATALDAEAMMKFIRRFNKLRPKLLFGYVGSVDHLASFIEANSLSVPAPKAIWVTSSPLTTVQERRIEKVFGAPVYDQYGCCEVYYLAAQCRAKKALHMFQDIRRIEFLDERNKPCSEGKTGRITITDLENYFFPLIRYLNGDMGRALPGTCVCGVNLPLMDKVHGRETDILRLPSGKCISGDYATTIFDDAPDAVKQFQVHQQADYSIKILVVPNSDYPGLEKCLARVTEKIRKVADMEVSVEVEKTSEIPQKGGKLRFVKSDVP